MKNSLFYGDNLDLLRNRKYVQDESVDLCYIDPPFNSKRRYNQIYNNRAGEDLAQAQAFVDIHRWDDHAIKCYDEIVTNEQARHTEQTIELIKGLEKVLKKGPLLAYIVGMTARIVEIHRVLKPTGSFYLHCDPTVSHYLKIVTDTVFCAPDGDFLNEIVWCYSIGGKSKKRFGKKHDVLLFYSKNNDDLHTFNREGAAIPRKSGSHMRKGVDNDGREYQEKTDRKSGTVYRYYLDEGKIAEDWWTDIETLNREDRERVGWPTQKPAALLDRIIRTSTNEGDVVLDAYCGCGTTIAVAQRRNRRWIGMDITYQAISTILNRFEDEFPSMDLKNIRQDGMPRDMESARALARKRDDRLRKEFEKWAILTYCNNKAIIKEKKGADKGIDGVAYILAGKASETAKMVLQAKSGSVSREDISKLKGDMEDADMAALITLEEPTKPMIEKAKSAGTYKHELTGKVCDKIRIVTVREMLEGNKLRLDLPQDFEAFKNAVRAIEGMQLELDLQAAPQVVTMPEPKKYVASVGKTQNKQRLEGSE